MTQPESPWTPPRRRGLAITAVVLVAAVLVAAVAVAAWFALRAPGPAGGEARDITGTDVTLVGDRVETPCYSFTLPEPYRLESFSEACGAELSRDIAPGADPAAHDSAPITVAAQSGTVSVDEFVEEFRQAARQAGREILDDGTRSIAGAPAGVMHYLDSRGVEHTAYFVPAPTAQHRFGERPLTSFLITGPTDEIEHEDALLTVIGSLGFP